MSRPEYVPEHGKCARRGSRKDALGRSTGLIVDTLGHAVIQLMTHKRTRKIDTRSPELFGGVSGIRDHITGRISLCDRHLLRSSRVISFLLMIALWHVERHIGDRFITRLAIDYSEVHKAVHRSYTNCPAAAYTSAYSAVHNSAYSS